ncbi:uncharacterized protein LOC132041078 isoform X5 [Lycium ferocissimum]|uniref:uncharacterized protein LOC132041078 isoform X5 n=1 Tax=Lycium ferocissimum TaxID=112874 RepID=UPI002815B2E1|nr:uncharacterized protein LOC132041078 isoform X5 [Lycium ferocissimum]
MSINDTKAAWIAYNVQSFCILSLLIQALLLILAPFRKKTGSRILMVLVWSAYMAADWAPAFILNLIINYSKTRHDKAELMSFWSSCMLLHLGGSDHAIAFTLEDNDLWFSVGLMKGQRQNASSCMPKICIFCGQKIAVSGVGPSIRSFQVISPFKFTKWQQFYH